MCIKIICNITIFIEIVSQYQEQISTKTIVMFTPTYYVQYHVICTSSVLVWIPFISVSSQIAMARTSKTTVNNSGQSGHLCLFSDFIGNAFNFSPLRIMYAVGLSYMAFIMLRQFPSMPTFQTFFFYHKSVNFVESFLCIY